MKTAATFSISNALPAMRSTPTSSLQALGGVFGRRAGAAPGYDYSPALKSAHLTWSVDDLNRWLAGPAKFIPGVKMPVSVPDPIARRDIVAYLRQESAQRRKGPTSQGGGTRGTDY